MVELGLEVGEPFLSEDDILGHGVKTCIRGDVDEKNPPEPAGITTLRRRGRHEYRGNRPWRDRLWVIALGAITQGPRDLPGAHVSGILPGPRGRGLWLPVG